MKFKPGKLLEAFGIGNADEDGLEMDFGPGVVGLTTFAFIAVVAAIAICAYALSSHPDVLLIIVFILAGVFVLFLPGTWMFAHYHQDLALLGGSKLLQYRKLQMAAANPAIMIDATPTSAPPLPTIEAPHAPTAKDGAPTPPALDAARPTPSTPLAKDGPERDTPHA